MNKITFIALAFILMNLISCTKVVNIDLNSANPDIVVDAQISDQPGPYNVSLTKTVNFSDDNIFPTVSGAIVVVSDNAGNSETLSETSPGNYTSANLQGTVGRTYNIAITDNGKVYTAFSTMFMPVVLDSVVADTNTSTRTGGLGGGGGGGNSNKNNGISIRAVFKDPGAITNYYRLVEYVNNVPNYKNIIVLSDKLQDGDIITSYVSRRDTSIHAGDVVTILLESIDVNAYEYFRTLKQVTSERTGLQAAVPGNPTSNLNNKALGFFSAYSVKSKSVIVP